MPKKTKSLSMHQKLNRKLVLTVSMFLLNQEGMNNLFWAVSSVEYSHMEQKIKVGIETTIGKYGTTLAKLRKLSKPLAKYLFDNGITFREAKITFFVDKEEQNIKRIYSIIEKVESV